MPLDPNLRGDERMSDSIKQMDDRITEIGTVATRTGNITSEIVNSANKSVILDFQGWSYIWGTVFQAALSATVLTRTDLEIEVERLRLMLVDSQKSLMEAQMQLHKGSGSLGEVLPQGLIR